MSSTLLEFMATLDPKQIDTKELTSLVGKYILHAKNAVNEVDNYSWTPLLFAAANVLPPCIAEILDNNADVNHTAIDGRNALHMVIEYGTMDNASNVIVSINYLLRAKIDINAKSALHTPIVAAITNANYNDYMTQRIIECLLDAGAQVDNKFINNIYIEAYLLKKELRYYKNIVNKIKSTINNFD